MEKILWKHRLVRSLKISAAAFAAIALAGELDMKYSATAGIITVLSIQNTKRETLKSAGKRWLAFLCALFISGICFIFTGYNLWGFGLYLFLFSLICLSVGWMEAIAMDSVLITHFLTEKNMGSEMLINEALLLLIGTGMGILVNMHLHKKESEFRRLANDVDNQMREILQRLSRWLSGSDRYEYESDCFIRLRSAIGAARECAVANYDNTILLQNVWEIDYISMREQQSIVLLEIYNNILKIRHPVLPVQASQIAELIKEVGDGFCRENTVERLLHEQHMQFRQMKGQPLPESREEFEVRAILYYILMQIKQFLEIKREFVLRSREM